MPCRGQESWHNTRGPSVTLYIYDVYHTYIIYSALSKRLAVVYGEEGTEMLNGVRNDNSSSRYRRANTHQHQS